MIDRNKLGASALEVPRICFGTMTFAAQNDEREAHALLDCAFERGVDFIDTAEVYPLPVQADTYGRTEVIVGTWLKTRARDRVIVATKVAGPGRGMDWPRTGARAGLAALSKRDVVLACEGSLKRLGTDYIDLYQVHWPARNVPLFGAGAFDPANERESASVHEQLEAMDQLVRDGKVRHVGVSNETAWGLVEHTRIARRYGLPRIASTQNIYNLMSREYEQAAAEAGFRERVGLLVYSPLAFGYLTGKYRGGARPEGSRIARYGERWPRYTKPAMAEAVERYCAIAQRHGLTPTQLALSFVYHRGCVASTIIGATTIAQLNECLDAWDVRLPAQALAEIDAVHAALPNPAP